MILAREMEKLGNRVRVLALHPPRRPFPINEDLDIRTLDGLKIHDPRCLGIYIREIQGFRPDVLHSFLLGFDFWANLAGRILRVPCILSSRRQLATWRGPRHIWWQNLGNLLADAAVANSQAAAEYCFAHERHLNRGRIFYVPNAYERRPTATPSALPRSEAPVLVHIANFWRGKGQAMLIRAFKQVLQTTPSASLWFVGEGNEQSACRALVKELGMEDRVSFMGRRHDIDHILARANVYIHASSNIPGESSSNAILEAMGSGVPVVATACGGVTELLRGGDLGTLVPPDDKGLLTAAMQYALGDDRQDVMAKARKAKSAAEEDHAPISIARQYAAIYNRLLDVRTGKETMPWNVVIYLLGDRNLPSAWFRVFQYVPALQDVGLDVNVHELPATGSGALRQFSGCLFQAVVRRRQLRHLKHSDVAFIQKGLTPSRLRGIFRSLTRSRCAFVYDIDDSVHVLAPVVLPRTLRWLQDTGEPEALMTAASRIIAGNRHLASVCRERNDSVTIVPTTVDTNRYWWSPVRDESATVIGWSGSRGTNPCVNVTAPVLRRLAANHRFVFRVMSSNPDGIDLEAFRGVNVDFRPWHRETEVATLRTFSIGIMPLPDSEWEQGKCGLKALTYMALGIPPVCSPVGVNREIIQDGVNGFLASSDDEWHDCLSILLHDFRKRQRMGRSARRTVEQHYSVSAVAPLLCDLLGKQASSAREGEISKQSRGEKQGLVRA